MEARLFKAAQQGDSNQLKALLQEDPLVLQNVAMSTYPNPPLHIATLAEGADFVKEMLRQRPSFAWDRNKLGLTPLHIASAIGNIDIVREILKVMDRNPHLCLMKDKDGQTALHHATMKGRVEVMEELLIRCTQAAREVTAKDQTALHLAVLYSQFEALSILVDKLSDDHELMNAIDCQGNTFFQLAQRMKQQDVLKLLRNQGMLNLEEIRHQEIQEDEENKEQSPSLSIDVISELGNRDRNENGTAPREEKKEKDDSSSKGRGSKKSVFGMAEDMIPIVAALLAQITYQAVLSPPPTIWTENMKLDTRCVFQQWKKPSISLKDSPKKCPASAYYGYMCCNTAGFISAVFLILSKATTGTVILPSLALTAIATMTFSYAFLLFSMSPDMENVIVIFGLALVLILCAFLFYYTFVKLIAWLDKPKKRRIE